jgi:hypothetical protein
MGGKGCKPSSVCLDFSRERTIYLSGRYPEPVPPERDSERAAPRFPIWPCTRWGLPCLRDCSWSGGLLPHLFTLTPPVFPPAGAVSFSVALSVGTPRGMASRVYSRLAPGLRGIAPCGVRTFLPRLSPGAILRPSQTRSEPRPGSDSWQAPLGSGAGIGRLSGSEVSTSGPAEADPYRVPRWVEHTSE